ncbi:hypothetical protein TYRP_010891 [Tyrophagus putrescentiae]|nr:hypothetical protein TYRP_010891 [Tyrophagus putrescentiae]
MEICSNVHLRKAGSSRLDGIWTCRGRIGGCSSNGSMLIKSQGKNTNQKEHDASHDVVDACKRSSSSSATRSTKQPCISQDRKTLDKINRDH